MSTPEHDPPTSEATVPPASVIEMPLSGLARFLVAIFRLVGIVILIAGIIVIKVTAKKNPGVALAMVAVMIVVGVLVWSLSSFLQMLARDAAHPVPSKAVGLVKLVLGIVAVMVFFIGSEITIEDFNPLPHVSLGVLPAAKYGPLWAGIYGLFVALGVLAMLSGLMAFVGQRLPTLGKVTVVLLVLAGCTLAAPAFSPLRLVHTIDTKMPLGSVRFSSFAFSPDGQRLAACTDYGGVRVFDTGTGLETPQFPGVSGTNSHATIAWSPDGQRLATTTEARTRVTDAATGKELFTTEGGGAIDTAFSADSRRLVCVGQDFVCVRDAADGKEIGRFAIPKLEYIPKSKVAISQDGTRVAVGRRFDPLWLKVWDTATGAEVMALPKLTDEVHSLAFSPDGKFLAAGGGGRYAASEEPGQVLIWDLGTGQQTRALPTDSKHVECVAFSPDGRYVAAISNFRTLKVWDAQTGDVALSFQCGNLGYDWMGFTPDGRTIATASGYRDFIQLWDVSRALSK